MFQISSSQALGFKAMPAIVGAGSTPLPCGHRLVHTEAHAWLRAKCGRGGLLGRTAKTESSSILAWRLLASPLGMGYLHGMSNQSYHPTRRSKCNDMELGGGTF